MGQICSRCCGDEEENYGESNGAYNERTRLLSDTGGGGGSSTTDIPEGLQSLSYDSGADVYGRSPRPANGGGGGNEGGRVGGRGDFQDGPLESSPYGTLNGQSASNGLRNDENAALNSILTSAAGEFIDVNNGTNGIPSSNLNQTGANYHHYSQARISGTGNGGIDNAEYMERAQMYGKRLASAAPTLAVKYNSETAIGTLQANLHPEEDRRNVVVSGQQEKLLAGNTISEMDSLLLGNAAYRAQDAFNAIVQPYVQDLVVPFGSPNHES